MAQGSARASSALAISVVTSVGDPGSDTNVPSEKAVRTAIAAAATGTMTFKGDLDCGGNPNYPAADRGDFYLVSVAGKVGGASGVDVHIGDSVVAANTNAGGDQAAVGTDWFILEHSAGALQAANNLSDLANAATARTNLSLDNVTNDVQAKASLYPNTAPAVGGILVGNAGGTAYAPVSMSGDVTIDEDGVTTVARAKLAQFVEASTSTGATTTSVIPVDDTIPQNTEGTEFITLAITPTNAPSKLRIEFTGHVSGDTAMHMTIALFQDSTANALESLPVYIGGANFNMPFILCHVMTAGTTSSTTFKIRFGSNSGANTASMIRRPAATLFSTTDRAHFTITEFLP